MLIGLSGKIGSGKNTAAILLREEHPQFIEVAFAENVKKVVAILTGTTFEENMDREKRKRRIEAFGATLGELQQKVGNGMRQTVGTNVWIQAVMSNLSPYTIITDVRFPDEVKAIEQAGGIVIRIERTEEHQKVHDLKGEFLNDMRPRNDITETALDDYPFERKVMNNGTLEEFKKALLQVL
jgi:hypothetical protein